MRSLRCKAKLCKTCKKRNAATPRSKLCSRCFQDQASRAGARSSGNLKGNLGNAGNSKAKGNRGNAGNSKAKGKRGNAGNSKGNPGNAGNPVEGLSKVNAGKRSGLKRVTKMLLVVKNPWLDMILDGQKDWEIRGEQCTKRGIIHLALSGAKGSICGRVQVVGCRKLAREDFKRHFRRHRVDSISKVKYANLFAWEFAAPMLYDTPLRYKHPQGAVKWVRL